MGKSGNTARSAAVPGNSAGRMPTIPVGSQLDIAISEGEVTMPITLGLAWRRYQLAVKRQGFGIRHFLAFIPETGQLEFLAVAGFDRDVVG